MDPYATDQASFLGRESMYMRSSFTGRSSVNNMDDMAARRQQLEKSLRRANESILAACRRGDMTALEYILTSNAEYNINSQTGFRKSTPLMAACENATSSFVKRLLEEKANVEMQDQEGTTALMIAASYGKLDSVDILLKAGADPVVEDKLGCTALYFASTKGNSSISSRLIKELATARADESDDEENDDAAMVQREGFQRIQRLQTKLKFKGAEGGNFTSGLAAAEEDDDDYAHDF